MGPSESEPLLKASRTNAGRMYVWIVYLGLLLLLLVNYVLGCNYLHSTKWHEGGIGLLFGSLWAPEYSWLAKTYIVGILVAAIGYLMNLNYMICVGNVLHESEKGYLGKICSVFAATIVYSQEWLPMCIVYIEYPNTIVFVLICVQLVANGILLLIWAVFVCQSTSYVQTAAGTSTKITGAIGACLLATFACLHACVFPYHFITVSSTSF